MRNKKYPDCRTAQEYLRASILAIDLLEGVRQGTNGSTSWDFEKDCECPQPCYRELFEMQSDTGYYDANNKSLVRVHSSIH